MPEEIEKQPQEAGEAPEETIEETPQAMAFGKTGELFGPAGLMMIPAVLLDLIGVILLCFGLDDFGVTDIIGILFIGGWMFSRSGMIAMPVKTQKRAQGWLRKLFRGKGKWTKYVVPMIGESIPYFGGIACCWTLAVYYELTS